ncbi:WAT1-related protein [Hibiscus syriacus]|uniref:WAT1-related protein n=1 Tax=Hibiscus syriacus TaxID=106335 RepID=A0A6A2Y2B5_HIBSY|nr:WAT1-related protein At4g08300-like [Hibiscus syriacus]KAE8674545.1 WAT1-related protein [Hibiscus syriacus]
MGEERERSVLSKMINKVKPFIAIVSLQFGYAGMYIISLISFRHGMSNFVLTTYRHLVATVVIAPFAFFLERKIRPRMTLPIFLRIVALGILEPVLDQNLYYLGMKATTATYASAFVNMLPAVTFVLAMIFRLEKINLKKVRSVAKIVGTSITVVGAMVMTLYKGPIVDFIKSGGTEHHVSTTESADKHWVTGTIMILASILSWAGYFILQSFTLKKYPAELSLTAWICLVGMIEDGIVALVMVRDLSAWKVGWDSRLLAAAYTGIVCSGIAYYVQGVVIRERGPVFLTSFSPLCMIITAALGTFVLGEKVHLGSILGSIIIVSGLYTVVWGKSKDGKDTETDEKIKELPITNSITSISVDDSRLSSEGDAKIVTIPASKSSFGTRGT